MPEFMSNQTNDKSFKFPKETTPEKPVKDVSDEEIDNALSSLDTHIATTKKSALENVEDVNIFANQASHLAPLELKDTQLANIPGIKRVETPEGIDIVTSPIMKSTETLKPVAASLHIKIGRRDLLAAKLKRVSEDLTKEGLSVNDSPNWARLLTEAGGDINKAGLNNNQYEAAYALDGLSTAIPEIKQAKQAVVNEIAKAKEELLNLEGYINTKNIGTKYLEALQAADQNDLLQNKKISPPKTSVNKPREIKTAEYVKNLIQVAENALKDNDFDIVDDQVLHLVDTYNQSKSAKADDFDLDIKVEEPQMARDPFAPPAEDDTIIELDKSHPPLEKKVKRAESLRANDRVIPPDPGPSIPLEDRPL